MFHIAYQPTYPEPYLTSIDATLESGNVFRVVINPKDIITKYKLTIYSEANASVYTTNVVTLSTPLYGSLDLGTTVDVVVPSTSGMRNGSNYTWDITLYDNAGGTVTTPKYYFTARSSPIINFTVDNCMTSCEYEFKASYSQAQGEKYLYYKFSLYSDGMLIDTSGEKMEANMTYKYSGLMSGKQYRIDLLVVMNDRTEYTISRDFSVEYDTLETPILPTVSPDSENGCIDIDYSQSVYIAGHTNKPEQYTTFQNATTGNRYIVAQLVDGQYVYYDKINESKPLDISNGFTIYLHANFLDLFVGKIIELTDEQTGDIYSVRYDGRRFYYKIPGKKEASVDPYVDDVGAHQETSCIHAPGTTIEDLKYDTLYMLYADDVLYDDSIFMYNDITKNFWWHITLLPDRTIFTKGDRYDESVVSE